MEALTHCEWLNEVRDLGSSRAVVLRVAGH